MDACDRAPPADPIPGRAIVFAADSDSGFGRGLAVTVRSLLERLGPDSAPRIYVLDCGLGDDGRARLNRLLSRAQPACRLTWVRVEPQSLAQLPVGGRFPLVVYARLLVAELLPRDLQRVVYLDSDLIVGRNITELFELDLEGVPFAAVEDFGDGKHVDGGDRAYLNTGVLVIDLSAWRAASLGHRAIRHVAEHGATAFPDQDALNSVADRWRRLDPTWNFQLGALLPGVRAGRMTVEQLHAIRAAHSESGLVLHYTVAKPWLPSQGARACSPWIWCYLRSGWDPQPRAAVWVGAWLLRRARWRFGIWRASLNRFAR